jgi:hypothetical protein
VLKCSRVIVVCVIHSVQRISPTDGNEKIYYCICCAPAEEVLPQAKSVPAGELDGVDDLEAMRHEALEDDCWPAFSRDVESDCDSMPDLVSASDSDSD